MFSRGRFTRCICYVTRKADMREGLKLTARQKEKRRESRELWAFYRRHPEALRAWLEATDKTRKSCWP
jgi:hypothetical protein